VIDGGLSVRATEHLVRKVIDGTAPSKTACAVDPNIRAAETKLRRALGTQVRIVQLRGEGQGKVEISFFSNQDLDRIYNLLLSATAQV
jgi:ParB family chromosome partitioning protein